jgi:hypothetical protein
MDFEKSGSPLGKSIAEEETPRLIDRLIFRLLTSPKILDLSPKSLNILATMLLNYYQQNQFTEEEIMQAIREVAAYIGTVIVTHSTGKWHIHHAGGLMGTEIVFEGPVKTIKGRQTVTFDKSVVSLGQIVMPQKKMLL